MNKNTHKMNIKIGGREIKAEYIEHDWTLDFIGSTKKKSKLHKLWDNIDTLYRRTKHKVRDAYWNIRYGFERMHDGYDSVDVFDTYTKFIDRYSKILTTYRKNHVGHCGTMTAEEWNEIIDEMIYHLHYMDENNVDDELTENVPESWIPTSETTYGIMNYHKDKFFGLFSEYFYHLWD